MTRNDTYFVAAMGLGILLLILRPESDACFTYWAAGLVIAAQED